ncbi:uncharacterized protein LOC124452746 [Xenia sp. Carnegie-2017]|uniref:uncharacterized protein LOC124452746 n=1 Tax=Xenia sp. Carnegie-2017 TaxID=2897299 RepID=UPI001F03CF9D|nr:uncharacterized protein LOC124452746 [Xenia sp. Carnegie-2017]
MAKPKVFIYNDDYNAMCTEVFRHQHIETGGNLFGLWTTMGNAVLHVVLGPGIQCKRTETSFHQDIDYLQRVGRLVNDKYMLCHIGEWHSHHSFELSKPSPGDESTIRRNFPNGVSKFLLIIANIRDGGDRIVLSPYFFTNGGRNYEKIEYVVLERGSPYSSVAEIQCEKENGAENGESREREMCSSHPTSNDTTESSLSLVQIDKNIGNGGQRDPDVAMENYSLQSPEIAAVSVPAESCVTNRYTAQTPREIVMKQLHDYLVKEFHDPKVEITKRENSVDIDMIFKLNRNFYLVRFCENFPSTPALLYCEKERRMLYQNSQPCVKLETPLNTFSNILLSIKKNCDVSWQHFQKIDETVLTKSDSPYRVDDFIKALCQEIQITFNTQATSSKSFKEGCFEIYFKHSMLHWYIEIPEEFPSKPAEVFKAYRKDGHKISISNSRKHLVEADHIISAIKHYCIF